MRAYLEIAAVMIVWVIAVHVGFFVLGVPLNAYYQVVAMLLSVIIGLCLAISQNRRGL